MQTPLPTYLDCSGLDCFTRCPFLYYLDRLLGLVPKGTDSTNLEEEGSEASVHPFTYGHLLHELLPLCYTESLDSILSLLQSRWSELNLPETEPKRNPSTATLLLSLFHQQRHGESSPYRVLDPIPHSFAMPPHTSPLEQPFLLPTGGPLPFAGRLDLVVCLKANNSLYALDFKTTSSVSTFFFQSFYNHPQTLGYSWALQALTGKPVNGLIIEALRVAPIPARPTSTPSLAYQPIDVASHKLDWFISYFNRMAEAILDCSNKQSYPRNFAGCSSYSMFGIPGSRCKFYNLCSLPSPDMISEEIERSYDQKPYNPLGPADQVTV